MSIKRKTFRYNGKNWQVHKLLGTRAEIVEVGDNDPYIITVDIKALKELVK